MCPVSYRESGVLRGERKRESLLERKQLFVERSWSLVKRPIQTEGGGGSMCHGPRSPVWILLRLRLVRRILGSWASWVGGRMPWCVAAGGAPVKPPDLGIGPPGRVRPLPGPSPAY